jgi:Trk-type K+ transport system membrane component
MFKVFFKNIFTEVDNKTFDGVKILAFISVFTALGLAIFSVTVLKQPFSFQDYGLGAAALFAGVGVSLGLKKDSNVN